MAATRLLKFKKIEKISILKSLEKIIDYVEDDKKTENKTYIKTYNCQAETAATDFHKELMTYVSQTKRIQTNKNNIAYMIRQSFLPGEISAKDANELGYELAMRFTKGEHTFIVTTHTDKDHIHNHIVFNAVDKSCSRKFRDFIGTGKSLMTMSDILSLEQGLSVIVPKVDLEREKLTHRDQVKADIKQLIKDKNLSTLDSFIKALEAKGYTVKNGKYLSVKHKSWSGNCRFTRIKEDVLGKGYSKESIEERLAANQIIDDKTKEDKELQELLNRPLKLKKYKDKVTDIKKIGANITSINDFVEQKTKFKKVESIKEIIEKNNKFSMLIDMQSAFQRGKNYTSWASKFNNKQIAKAIIFLRDNGITSQESLENKIKYCFKREKQKRAEMLDNQKHIEELKELKVAIINYSKNKEILKTYKDTNYSKSFYNQNKTAIDSVERAKQLFNAYGKIPKLAEINIKLNELFSANKQASNAAKISKREMEQFLLAREISSFLLREEETKDSIKEKEKESRNEDDR